MGRTADGQWSEEGTPPVFSIDANGCVTVMELLPYPVRLSGKSASKTWAARGSSSSARLPRVAARAR